MCFSWNADIIIRPYLVGRSLDYLRDQGLYAVTANVMCKSGIFLDEWYLFTMNTLGRFLGFGTGMFLLFDREKFWELGGFDPRIVYAEDIHLTLQVGKKQFRYVPGYVLTDNRRFRKWVTPRWPGSGSGPWLISSTTASITGIIVPTGITGYPNNGSRQAFPDFTSPQN